MLFMCEFIVINKVNIKNLKKKDQVLGRGLIHNVKYGIEKSVEIIP